ncbi:MAG TPA: hypothetical protein IGS53_03425 [Leptolyngbyaceae cyanobacterium M33_DOE_097]|uniref:Uncharacterized protein n=1 Tax=Oscillatoriales cyanobacterium SpSt-418 TaxID=2282169 RepID=A0A7C3KGT0_9CYAN|nr:hypothetical protein [Leptolyngbyaceae cyanobacterium M33_DOE_097]
MLKSFYRREPIIAFAVTIGAVDAVLGGVSQQYSLLWFGLGLSGVAIALRWWQSQQVIERREPVRSAQFLLPPQSSSNSLPMLTMSKKKPPER